MKPNLICPGAPKTATTYLGKLLNQNPDIYIPSTKETHFFSDDIKYSKGIKWYLNTFYKNAESRIRCDFSPSYLNSQIAPKRIKNDLDRDIKFIFMLRNPIERAVSEFKMRQREQCYKFDFNTYLNDFFDGKKVFDNGELIENGLYYKHINKYVELFERNNMFFIIFEDFIINKPIIIKKISEFLNIKDTFQFDYNIKINKSGEVRYKFINKLAFGNYNMKVILKRLIPIKFRIKLRSIIMDNNIKNIKSNFEINSELKQKLINYYKDDVLKLETQLNLDIAKWNDFNTFTIREKEM